MEVPVDLVPAVRELIANPQSDVAKVVAAVASLGSADGDKLREVTGLPPGRLNRAVDYLRDQGLAEVVRWLGTHPFNFGLIEATRRTRQAVERLKPYARAT